MTLTAFDGQVRLNSEGSWTLIATGEQIPTLGYVVTPVARYADVHMPLTIEVAVAKDSGKVLAIKPDLPGP